MSLVCLYSPSLFIPIIIVLVLHICLFPLSAVLTPACEVHFLCGSPCSGRGRERGLHGASWGQTRTLPPLCGHSTLTVGSLSLHTPGYSSHLLQLPWCLYLKKWHCTCYLSSTSAAFVLSDFILPLFLRLTYFILHFL